MTSLRINGQVRESASDPETPLLYVLRNDFALNAAKYGCGLGQCSACLVLIDGAPTPSCLAPIEAVANSEVTTVEGLANDRVFKALQAAFLAEQAAQCGYCTAGMLIRAHALLKASPHPGEVAVREGLADNLCRCGAQMRILRAVMRAARDLKQAAGA